MPRLVSWKDKAVLITGASSGIGRLIAIRVAAAGAHVALVARREDRLRSLAEEIGKAGGEAMIATADVQDRAQVFSAADRVLERFGKVDVLINNAGYGHHRPFISWDVEDMERMLKVNFLGSLYFTKALVGPMVERRSGWIVFIASVAGKIGVPEESAYVASKFAMVGFAESLAIELEDANIHVLTVCPGTVDTEFFDEEALKRMPPVARRSMIRAEMVADATLRALARGKQEITVPGGIAAAYIVKAFAPGFLRKSVKRTTIGAVGKRELTPPVGEKKHV
jgi:uncharacterized protein